MSELKANELRIGNWVYDNFNDECYPVPLSMITEAKDQLSPIPLTEEWLVKLGFEKFDDDGYSIKVDNATLIIDIEDFSIGVFHSEYDYNKGLYFTPNKCFRTVHQLQNLFFALTGTELTIKE